MMEQTQSNNSFVAFNLPDEDQNTQQKDFEDNSLQFINTNYELNSEPTTPTALPMTSIKFTELPEGIYFVVNFFSKIFFMFKF
jgi:hypothetical protein